MTEQAQKDLTLAFQLSPEVGEVLRGLVEEGKDFGFRYNSTLLDFQAARKQNNLEQLLAVKTRVEELVNYPGEFSRKIAELKRRAGLDSQFAPVCETAPGAEQNSTAGDPTGEGGES